MNIYYTIYKTTNTINNKIYIGKHKTTDLNDDYLGSGIALTDAIKKYGRENFTKEILYVLDNEYDMNNKECEIITEEFISLDTNYNMMLGGQGGWSLAIESRMTRYVNRLDQYNNNPQQCQGCGSILTHKSRNNKFCSHRCQNIHQNSMSELSPDRRREIMVKRNISGDKNGMYNKKHSPESIEQMKINRKGKNKQPKSAETKEKMRLAAIARWAKQKAMINGS